MTDTGMFFGAAVGATVLAIMAHLLRTLLRMLAQGHEETALEPTLENLPQLQDKAAKEYANQRSGDRILFGICWTVAGFLWVATIASAYRT